MATRYGQSKYTPEQTRAIILQELRKAAAENGLGEDWVRFSLSIPSQESGYIDNALNDGSRTKTNEYSVGPWQANLRAHTQITPEQATDPAWATRWRVPALISAWNALGGSAKAAANPLKFQADYHAKAQVSWVPTAQQSRDALAAADAGIAGGGALQNLPGTGQPNDLQNLSGTGEASVLQPLVQVNRTPVQGGITSKFGTPFGMDSGATYQGQQYAHFNKGVDYGVAGGTPVQAVVGGIVKLAADDGSGWGPRVVIVDAEGFEHSYGHLGQLAVKPGQQVEAGQQIAVVGSGKVGTSTGEHLSYDIFKNGEPVDPSPWLGQNVVDPAIQHDPAKAQVPAYLSGASSAQGGTGMATTSATSAQGSSVAAQQLARAGEAVQQAQGQVDWLQYRTAELQVKAAAGTITAAEQAELQQRTVDNGTGFSDMAAAQEALGQASAAYTGWQTALANEQKLAPQPAPTDTPAQRATAQAGILGDQFTAQKTAADLYLSILDKTFGAQLGISGVIKDILIANQDALTQYTASQISKGELDLAGATALVTGVSLKQAAQATQNAETLARAKYVSDTDFRNVQHALAPGTEFVPFLEPAGIIGQAYQRAGMTFPGMRVTHTDWSQLDPRRTLTDAEGTLPPLADFDTPLAATATVAAQNAQIEVPKPKEITTGDVQLPSAPNYAGVQVPSVPNYDSILQGLLAPPPQPAPSTVTAPAQPAPTPPAAATTPATATATPLPPNRDPNMGSVITDGTGQAGTGLKTQVSPVQPSQPAAQGDGGNPADALKAWLKKWGIDLGGEAVSTVTGVVGNPAGAANAARKWITR